MDGNFIISFHFMEFRDWSFSAWSSQVKLITTLNRLHISN